MSDRKKIKIAFWLALIVLAVTLVGSYIWGIFYFRTHFLPKTSINGHSVSGMTGEQAFNKLREAADQYSLSITDLDGEKTYLFGSDFDYTYLFDGKVNMAISQQNVMAWPAALFTSIQEEEFSMTAKFDETKLSNLVSELPCLKNENIVHPQDARIDMTENGYEIIPEVEGNELDQALVQEKILEAVKEESTSILLDDSFYKRPTITSTDESLTSVMDNIEHYLRATITYEFDGCEEKIDRATISKWLILKKSGKVSLDNSAIQAFVQSLASKYNTYGDVREFATSSGDTIEIGGGDYGWVIDKEKEYKQIKKELKAGKAVERSFIFSQRAFEDSFHDIDDTYVEIDMTKQHLWYYKDGSLITETDVVTGNISRGNGTPDGIFRIQYKKSPAVLVGETYQSNVNFFMPFCYNVGIHDASWRGSFGGDIYKYSGSHGCVNVPYEAAQTIYDNIEEGTPVIAFYRDEVQLTAENAKISNAYSYVGD